MYSIVLATVPSKEVGVQRARELVDRRMAACVNILPATSVYRWEGKVQEDEEHILIIKTRRTFVDDIRDLFDEQHPYDLPDVIALEVEDGSAEYLNWWRDETDRA